MMYWIFTIDIYDQEIENVIRRLGGKITKEKIVQERTFSFGKSKTKYNFYGYEYTIEYEDAHKMEFDVESLRRTLPDHYYRLHTDNSKIVPNEGLMQRIENNFKIVFRRELRNKNNL